mgnify:CR=1 FL=1
MARKTNKTSHVLNLITGGAAPQEEEPGEVKNKQAQKEAPSKEEGATALANDLHSPTRLVSSPSCGEQKVTVVDSSEDEKLSNDIRCQLLNELNLGEDDKAQEIQKQNESQKTQEFQKTQEVQKQPEGRSGLETAVQSDRQGKKQNGWEEQDSVLADQPVSQPETTYRMINVMEEIIDEDMVREEMEKYEVCMCSRCQADVRALLLTRLPAKYVVVDRTAVQPLLSYYKNRYRVNLLTQTIKACMDVRDNPRHERKIPYDLSEAVDN